MRGLTLVLGLALQGMVLDSHLITNDNAAWWRMVSSLMCALICRVPLVAALLRTRLCHGIQASHTVGLDRVESGDVH